MAKSEIEFAAEQAEKMTGLLRNGILAAINEDNTYLYADVVDYMMAHGATVPVRCKDCENSRAIKETDPNAHEYDEEKDCFWIPECWWEVNSVEDNGNWIIDSDYEVTHWMQLPEPAKGE